MLQCCNARESGRPGEEMGDTRRCPCQLPAANPSESERGADNGGIRLHQTGRPSRDDAGGRGRQASGEGMLLTRAANAPTGDSSLAVQGAPSHQRDFHELEISPQPQRRWTAPQTLCGVGLRSECSGEERGAHGDARRAARPESPSTTMGCTRNPLAGQKLPAKLRAGVDPARLPRCDLTKCAPIAPGQGHPTFDLE